MSEKCPYAYRKRGDVSIHCKLMEYARFTYCGHSYFCGVTRRWEASDEAANCTVRNDARKAEKAN